ncbi:M48 family metalloprotease [Nocardia sp. NPDC057227]|uniref:M48 family metalloprotease n=1 Tax=Nocardia sp. NPDC057227 TaxID=3346056 RepID=UPI00363CD68A
MAVRSVDQRVLGAGTTVRFGLLLVLLLAAGASAISSFFSLIIDPDNNDLQCLLASGVDPNSDWLTVLTRSTIGEDQTALAACLEQYAQSPPWWGPILGIGLLLVVAGAFFWGIPAWKGRRSQVVAVAEVDVRGDLVPALEELVRTAGVDAPTFLVNPGRITTSAVVFGRPGRYAVCLDGGLIARRKADPTGFHAVVLHELAHIRNRDVPITYATVALWRTFLIAVLVPQTVTMVWGMTAFETFAGEWPPGVRSLLSLAVLTVLVYLTRADILRNREIYADLDAVDWGADPAHWPDTDPGARHLFASFLELWRTHPRWDQRRKSLTDPAVLFGLEPLPVFLTGVAAIFLGDSLPDLLSVLFPGAGWPKALTPWLTALPITMIIGVALWRAVAHAVLTERRPPSGVRTGLWLGVGLVVGELVRGGTSGNKWFPSRPEYLVLLIVAAVVIAWWTGQCAELFIRAWRGRTLRPAMFAGLAVSWVAFSFWFDWWNSTGALFAIGFPFGNRYAVTQMFPESATGHAGLITLIALVMAVRVAFINHSVTTWVAVAMWLVPLLVWTVRPTSGVPRWVHRAMPDAEAPPSPAEQLPSLRKILYVALLGGALGALAEAAVMAYQHTWQPPADQRGGLYVFAYLNLMTSAVSVAPIAAAVAAAVIFRRYRLPVALIAANGAALAAFGAVFVLFATDGCLGPFNTLASSCHWLPAPASDLTQLLVPDVLGPGMFAAATAVLLVQVVERLINRDRPAHSTGPIPSPRGRWVAERVGIAVVGIVGVGLTTSVGSPFTPSTSAIGHPLTDEEFMRAPAGPPVAPEIRRAQMHAWLRYGGLDRTRPLGPALTELSTTFDGQMPTARVTSLCTDINRMMQSVNAYFPVPDPALQPEWSKAINGMMLASADCQRAIQQNDGDLLLKALTGLVDNAEPAARIMEEIASAAQPEGAG